MSNDIPDVGTLEETSLSQEQLERVEALAIARATLVESTRSFGAVTTEKLPKRFPIQDLIDMAQWIVDGTDPLAGYREESEARAIHRPLVIQVPDDTVDLVRVLVHPADGAGVVVVPQSAGFEPNGLAD